MSVDLDPDTSVESDDYSSPSDGRRSVARIALVCVIALALAVMIGAGGWLVGQRSGSSVADNSVDAGFLRDMSTHHQQAITMANYERDNTSNPSIRLLAYDIEDAQTYEVGQMQGWLIVWGLKANTSRPQMAWMAGHGHLASDGLMPGMATPDEINHLETLTGTALDIDFLQLMIRHHQGGLPMAQYAEQHASQPYVRTLAGSIVADQSSEIIEMEQMLRQLGASPLPPPAS